MLCLCWSFKLVLLFAQQWGGVNDLDIQKEIDSVKFWLLTQRLFPWLLSTSEYRTTPLCWYLSGWSIMKSVINGCKVDKNKLSLSLVSYFMKREMEWFYHHRGDCFSWYSQEIVQNQDVFRITDTLDTPSSI